jgi:outer membrane protein TolC
MKTFLISICQTACVTGLALTLSVRASAQGSGTQAPPGAQPAPVPLSGRAPAGAVAVTQNPAPGATTGINTLNPTIQISGPYVGSIRPARRPLAGPLTLPDALTRGLEYNLGGFSLSQTVNQAHGQRTVARSVLLPNIVANLNETRQAVSLAAFGLHFNAPIPGFSLPAVVPPFNVFDVRGHVSQTVMDITALNNYRAARETASADELSALDARDLVVLAVGGAYLQTLAARARVTSSRTQVETANVLHQQNVERRAVGLIAQVDVDRSQIQALTEQQRLITLQNDFAKQKISLARMIGMAPTDQYDLADYVPFATLSLDNADAAVRQAIEQRADIKSAGAQVRAAERALAAARAERLPTVTVNADYGAIGQTPSDARGTFSVVGAVRVPIWQGGRTAGEVLQAEAAVAQRRAEFEDLTNQVEGDIRKTYLDLQATKSQVDLAEQNLKVSRESLDLTRQRFEAGVTDNVEVVQAQESVATADLDYINSVFAYNVAKLNLARQLGQADSHVAELLKGP